MMGNFTVDSVATKPHLAQVKLKCEELHHCIHEVMNTINDRLNGDLVSYKEKIDVILSHIYQHTHKLNRHQLEPFNKICDYFCEIEDYHMRHQQFPPDFEVKLQVMAKNSEALIKMI